MVKNRPAETSSFAIGVVIAAILGIDDQEFPALVSVAIGSIAALVTWGVEKRRGNG